jgi:hypothetical protein
LEFAKLVLCSALASRYAAAMKLSLDGSTPKNSPVETPRLRRRAGALAAAAIASLWSSAALADQFVVVDSTWEHTPDLADSHYRVAPLAGSPADWRKPIDYASGTAHVHLEVSTKPTDTPTKFQVCFEATPTYACTDQSPTYTAVGVLDWETPFSNFWSPPGTSVDWAKGTNKIAIILKDTKNGKPSADNVGAQTAALYTPTQVHMVVTIVAPGSTYVPPPPPMVDAGTDSGAGAGGAGGADAGGSTSTGTIIEDAGTTEDAGDGEDAGASSGPSKSDSGCSVGPARGGARDSAWVGLALAAIGLARLRRRG